jgi:hypothetical protein
MSVPPESIEAGKCYLTFSRQVRRVVRLMPDRRVQFEQRPARHLNANAWQPGMQDRRSFAAVAEREVPCGWTPETEAQP